MASDSQASSSAASAGPSAPRRRPNWLGWGLAVVILISCILFIDPAELLAVIRRFELRDLVLILAIFTLDRLLMGVKWWVLLRLLHLHLPVLRVIRYFYAGSLTGIFLPSHVGGDILRAHWVARDTKRTYPAYASLVMERLLGLISAANWAIVGGMVCAVAVLPGESLLWVGLGVLGLVLANGLFVLSLTETAHGFILKQLARKENFKPLRILHRFYEAYSRFSENRAGLALAMTLTVIEHGVQMVYFYAIAWALDVAADPWLFVAATAVYTLLLRLPIAPDGWGVGELAAIAVYGLIGVSAATAFSVSFMSHILIMIGLAPGLVFLLWGQGQPTETDLAQIEAERARVQALEAASVAQERGSA